MAAFIIRRLAFLPFVWLAVSFAIFAMISFLGPLQRLSLYVPLDPERLTRKLGKEQLELLIDKYGLDDPVMVQYGNWLGQVADGNLGWSKTAQAPVVDGFKQRLPVTLELAVLAAAPMLLVAIWMGVQSAVHQNEWPDHVLRLVTIAGSSLPLFVFGIFALMIFYGALDWFPPGRLSLWAEEVVYGGKAFTQYTGLVTVDAILNRRLDVFTDALRHLILPVITLSYVSWAVLLRVTRTSMLETLRQDYITTARAKGVREHDVYFTHARRNAMIPVTTLSVNSLVGLLLGVFVTETIYNIKGLGHWGVQSASLYDVPAILGITLFATSLIVLGNLAADILYARLDPRIRY